MGDLKEFTFNVELTAKYVAESEEEAIEQLEIALANEGLEADRIDLYEWEKISKEEMKQRWGNNG